MTMRQRCVNDPMRENQSPAPPVRHGGLGRHATNETQPASPITLAPQTAAHRTRGESLYPLLSDVVCLVLCLVLRQSASVMVTDSMTTGVVGRSPAPVGTFCIRSMSSRPFTVWPNKL